MALVVFNLGYRALAPAVLLSGLTVFVGETLFGQGYGVGASSETALILAGAVALTDLLVGWFAVYARGGRQRYLNLFEHANDAIFVHDPRGRIREVNPRAAELLGYSTDELLGMTVADLSTGCPAHLPGVGEEGDGGHAGPPRVQVPAKERGDLPRPRVGDSLPARGPDAHTGHRTGHQRAGARPARPRAARQSDRADGRERPYHGRERGRRVREPGVRAG